MANINPITGEVEEEKPTTPEVDFVYEPEVEFVYEEEPTVIDRIGAGLGRAAAAVVPDVIGTAAERAAETVVEKVGRAYDWAQEPPQFVKNIVADADKALKEAPAGTLEEKLAAVGLFSGAFVEPMTSPLGLATLGSGAAVRPVVAAARAGVVAPEVAQAVQAVSAGVNIAGALPAAEAAGAALGEASVEPTAANIGTAAGNVALALLGGVGAAVDAFGAVRPVVPEAPTFPLTAAERAAQGQMPGRGRGVAAPDADFAQRARVVSDREWENIRSSVRSVQAVDEAQQAALPAGEQAALLEGPARQLAIEGGQRPLGLPPAPEAQEFIRTVIPTGETIRVPEVPTEAQVSTARELAKTKAFNEKVKRITDTFLEDGIKLNRKQAAEMARITDPREYSLTRQAILDANRPLEAGAVENPPAKTRTPLKGFGELTPEMVGVRPEEPVAPKKTGVVAGEVPVLEGPAKAPEGLGEAPLPTTPRMLELERPMYDSGLVDAQGNTVWVDEQGRTIDRRTYEDPRERVRTPEEQAIYDRQLAERVEFDKRAEAAEQVDKIAAGDEVMVSLPDAPAPTPAAFVGKNPQNPSTSRVMTPQGETVVPNTAIESAAKANAKARIVEPVVTKVKDPTIGGWDVEIGANKYRIFRDPEDRWWYLDSSGPATGRVLSTGAKAEAIRELVENEDKWIAKIDSEARRLARDRRKIARQKAEAKKAPGAIPSDDQLTAAATTQRDLPEATMLQVVKKNQDVGGPAIYNDLLEHVGDLSHRIQEPRYIGMGPVGEKLNKLNRRLPSIEQEMEQSFRNNAEYQVLEQHPELNVEGEPVWKAYERVRKRFPKEIEQRIAKAKEEVARNGREYAQAHTEGNKPITIAGQLSRQAAIELGNGDFTALRETAKKLTELYNKFKNTPEIYRPSEVTTVPEVGAPIDLLPGLDTETEGVELALSASTGSIRGLERLHKASQTDPAAAQLLSDVAADSLRYLFRDIESVKVEYTPAVGLYGGELEGSLRVRLTFGEADKGKVLSRISIFAKNFNQEQVHMRSGAPKGSVAGTAYPDGSFNTVVMSWDAKGLKRPQIEKLAKESGLYGFTVSDDRLLAYYVGGANDTAKIKEFTQAGNKVSKSLGKGIRRVERLWIYGRGGLEYPEVRGELPVATTERNATAQRIAARIAAREVKPVPQAEKLTPQQTKVQTQVSKSFEAMRMNALDTDWKVKRAYTELAEELLEQYDSLPVKVEILSGKGEPYKNSQAMRSDVLGNNHLFIFGTDAKTFGPEGIKYDNHPLLQDSGRVDLNGKPLLFNDLLRAVHDYYAHTMTPVQFGVLGEEAAWRNHMAMTRSPWARWALTSETRGQNSYVNFGPDAAWNKAHPKDTKFAPQKTDLLPVEFAKTGDPILDAEMDAIGKMRKPDYERQRTKRVYTNKERASINVAMLNYLGQSAIGTVSGYAFGYNKDPNAPLEEKVMNGLLFAIMGFGVGNPTIRNAVLNGVYKAKIPVKYFGPQIKRAAGGMDNFVIFTKSVLGGVYDVIKSEAPLAESLKNKAATALDTLESMRAKADPNDWYAVGQFLSNHGNPNNILNSKLREAAMIVRSTIDDFTIDMIGSGLVRPGSDLEFTMMMNRGTYLTRTYEIFTNPDFQYDPAKQQRAIAEYVAQLRLDGDTRPTSVLQQEGLEQTLFQLAKTQGTAMAPNARSFALGKGIARVDGSILKPRKELSDAWRQMMGEIDDPVRAATLTIDRMADIVAAETTQTAMADVGLRTGLFSRQATPTHNVPLVNVDNQNLYGPLNKLWTTRDVADGLQTMRAYRSHSLPFRTLAFITGNIKIGKTVLHPISYAPNFISALMQPMVQGHYMQMVFNPRNYRDAFSIVFDSPFPSNMAQVEADLPMLIKQGLLRQSVNLNDLLETARASGATALGSRMVTWFPKGTQIPKKIIGGALSAYGKAEEFPRIIGFYAEAGRYAKALFGKDLNQLNPNERAVVYDRAVTVSKEVYPNSQAVPEAVKKLSVSGVLEPFVAFKYEVFRTTYETMRRGMADVSEGVQTRNPRLTVAGMTRISSLIGALYGAYAINQAFNETRGLSGEQDEALRRRLPDWDKTGLLVITDFNQNEVAYANQSYILPQSVPVAAINAALEGRTPVEAAAAFVKETAGGMVSDGGLFIKPVMEAVTGYNEYGRRIYPRDGGRYMDVSNIQSNAVRDAATGGQNLVVGAMHVLRNAAPGFMTESMKWYKAAKEEVGPDGQVYQTGDLLKRLAGVRVQRINLPLQFERHAGELFSRFNDARTEFGRARNRKDATPGSIEEAYQMSEQSRKIIFRDLVQHIRDGELLKQPKEQVLTNLRKAGIPSDLLLGAINGFYVPGMKEQTISARERFEAMMLQPEAKRLAMWSQIQATEPMLARAFRPLFQEMAQARTQEERMILALDDNDGTRARMIAQMILKQPNQITQQIKYQELLQRGMIKGQTANQLYGDPQQAAKIWSEAAVLLKNGSNPVYFPQVTPDATLPTSPGATMRRPQAAPAPAPQPVAPTRTPAPSSKFKEGQYYRDKPTGKIMQYVNGQFVPVQP